MANEISDNVDTYIAQTGFNISSSVCKYINKTQNIKKETTCYRKSCDKKYYSLCHMLPWAVLRLSAARHIANECTFSGAAAHL